MINKKLTLILLLILIIFLLIYYLNNYNFYNNILLLKFVDNNNNNKIISKYPINNYPNKYKIKIYNIKENIIPIPSTYIENFSLCYGEKGLDGNEGEEGSSGIGYENGNEGIEGSRGPAAVYKSCNGCSKGEDGKNGEKGNLVKSVKKINNKIYIKYDNGKELVTGYLKGVKGDKRPSESHHIGPQGPSGPILLYIDRNHRRKYLAYIAIQRTTIRNPFIHRLANNCVMFAMIENDGKTRPAILFVYGDKAEKLGYPDKDFDRDTHDGGDWTGIVTVKAQKNELIFKIHHSVNTTVQKWVPNKSYRGRGYSRGNYVTEDKRMTVVSFWFD